MLTLKNIITNIVEEEIAISGKPLKDHLETIGHAEAYDFICALAKRRTILEKDLQQMHKLIYFHIDEALAGTYRRVKAIITGSKYPLLNPQTLSSKIHGFSQRIARMVRETQKDYLRQFLSYLKKRLHILSFHESGFLSY